MGNMHHKRSDQVRAEALTKSIRAEVTRLKRVGTKEEAVKILKSAGIVDRNGNLTKRYRPS